MCSAQEEQDTLRKRVRARIYTGARRVHRLVVTSRERVPIMQPGKISGARVGLSPLLSTSPLLINSTRFTESRGALLSRAEL